MPYPPGVNCYQGLYDGNALVYRLAAWRPSFIVTKKNLRLRESSMTLSGFASPGSHWTGVELLTTCHQTYEEVLPILLSTNTLAFNFFEHFNLFRTRVGIPRLPCIRYLHFGLVLSHENVAARYPGMIDQEQWRELWNTVARELTGLRELDLELYVPSPLDMTYRWCHRVDAISTRSYDSWYDDLPGWADDLKALEGRLRRARFMVSPEAFYIHGLEETSASPLLYSMSRLSWQIIKLAERLQDMQSFVTRNGKGAGMTWLSFKPSKRTCHFSGGVRRSRPQVSVTSYGYGVFGTYTL
jgi:hypothetical protein